MSGGPGRGLEPPGTGPQGATDSLRGIRWGLVGAGLLLAYLAGLAIGLAVRAAGWWTAGAPWEYAVLAAAHATVSPALDVVMLTLPWIGTNYTLMPVVALAVVWLWRRRLRREAVHLLVVQLGSALLNPALKFSLVRERPHIYPLRGQFALPSFPSGHAIAVTAVVFTAACLARRRAGVRWPLLVAGAFWVVVMYSRLYLAVHWPTDVIAGIVVGSIWLATTLAAFGRDGQRASLARTDR